MSETTVVAVTYVVSYGVVAGYLVYLSLRLRRARTGR